MTPNKSARVRVVLLTEDEGRSEVVRSAVVALGRASCSPDGRLAILWGVPGGSGWSTNDELLAREHRQRLEWVNEAGHGAVIAEELLGVMTATGLDTGEFHDLDLVAAQLPVSGEQLAS
jgi:hypothetical protein